MASMSPTSFRSIGFILSVVLGGAAGCNRPLGLSKPDGAAGVDHGGSIAVGLDGATAVVDGGSSTLDAVRDAAITIDTIDASAGTMDAADARLDAADGSPDAAPVHHGALAVAIGDAHACALRDDHTVRCWGEVAPADRGPSKPVVAVAAGGGETCAILDDGSVTCWSATWGEGWSAASPTYDFGPDRRAVALAMGDRQSACAVLDDGSARCWNYAQTGPTATESTLETLVPPDGAPPLKQLVLGWEDEVISLYADGTIGEGGQLKLTSGRLLTAQPATTIANLRGDSGWCAMFAGNGLFCWAVGQVPASGSAILTDLALGQAFSCGLRPNGTVSCWGPSCGGGDYWCMPSQNQDKSYDVALGQPAVSIATGTGGAQVTCAVLADGSVKCWSYSPPDQCSDTVNGEGVCQAIIGTSVEVVSTYEGLKYGAWHAIDLDDPP